MKRKDQFFCLIPRIAILQAITLLIILPLRAQNLALHKEGYYEKLGFHPGENAMVIVSGVGSKSSIIAYEVNREDGSYVPGGTIKDPVILKPAFSELKSLPYLWQESEYMIDAQHTGGAALFMFQIIAATDILNH